jgi:hypothetical protein
VLDPSAGGVLPGTSVPSGRTIAPDAAAVPAPPRDPMQRPWLKHAAAMSTKMARKMEPTTQSFILMFCQLGAAVFGAGRGAG